MIFVEYESQFETWEVTQSGGLGILSTQKTRQAAISDARRYADPGEDIVVKGPRMSTFKDV